MRDGTILSADVWRPSRSGRYPVLLQRTPYDRRSSFSSVHQQGLEPLRAVERGYAVVIQNTRGRYSSEGAFRAFFDEPADGADTISWIQRLPFSNGLVGMYGSSYAGATQLLAATQRPGGLRAIAPHATASEYYEGWTYRSGAFQLGFALYWALSGLGGGVLARRVEAGEDPAELRTSLLKILADPWETFRRLPLVDVPVLADLVPSYVDWLAHPERDDFWRAIAISDRYDEIAVPALHIGGWHDLFLTGTIDNFVGLRERAKTETARRCQRLVIGPWAHGVPYEAVGELNYGPSASQSSVDMTNLHLDWFDAVLSKDGARGVRLSPVRIFVMGANVWRDEEEWPLSRARETRWHLRAGQLLSLERPTSDEPADVFVYDPRDPVPTVGGAVFLPGLLIGQHAGPRDQRAVEARRDVLVYTSPPLERDIEVTGPVSLTLCAATTACDTDWTAKLVDVDACGRALSITDGIIRARYRDGCDSAQMLEPGAAYRYEIDLAATSVVFPAGHRIRIQISSSNFPRFDRNPNHGGTIADATEADLTPALQTVFHSSDRPSFLQLPIVPD